MSGIEKVATIVAAGLIAVAVAFTLTNRTANTSGVITSLGKAYSGAVSASEGRTNG